MIYVCTPSRAKGHEYLMMNRRVDPANHFIVTNGQEAAVVRKPTEHDEIVFLGANLSAWDFFQAWVRGER